MRVVDTMQGLTPDLDQAERFLAALDEEAESFCFQVFDDDKERSKRNKGRYGHDPRAKTLFGSLEELSADLVRYNRDGCGIYVTVNRVDGSTRTGGNVTKVRAVFADQDKQGAGLPEPPIEYHLLVESSPGKYHAYWMVEGLALKQFRPVQKAIAGFCNSDPAVNDLPRVMRLPGFWHMKDPQAPHMTRILEQDQRLPYDAEAILAAFPPTHAERPAHATTGGATDAEQKRALKIAFDAARRTHEDPASSRHLEIVKMGHCLRRDRVPLTKRIGDLVLATFAKHMRPSAAGGAVEGMDEASAAKALRDAYQRPSEPDRNRPYPGAEAPPADPPPDLAVVGGTDFDPRPLIRMAEGKLPQRTDDAEQALLDTAAEIYQHGNRLVRVGRWEAASGPVNRPAGSGVLVDITQHGLIDIMTRAIRFQRYDKRASDWINIDAPGKVANTLLARVGDWRFSHLLGFCDSPTLDLQGRVITEPGYDEPTGLYLTVPPKICPIGKTSRQEARNAAARLFKIVSTFPFTSEGSQSAALALLMTSVFRRVLPSAPIGCISASTPGTGKSLLANCVSALCTGRTASVTALGKDGEELEKRIDSILLKGDACCVFDNVDRAIKSDVLCQITTESHKSVRVLAQSRIVEAPTNTLLMATGNNLTLIGDLTRRALIIHMDAGVERPERRQFDRDAIAHVLKHRAAAIRDVILIAKSYLDAGAPPQADLAPFGSFEDWDRMVRRPLVWVGWADPLGPAENLRDQDHEFVGMADLLVAWRALLGDTEVTAAELYEHIIAREGGYSGDTHHTNPALAEAAITVMGDPRKWGARELGYKLRAWQGRIIGGHRVVNAGKSNRGVQWKATEVVF